MKVASMSPKELYLTKSSRALVVWAGRLRCALPVTEVEEVLRPVQITPLSGAPAFVLGVIRLRGQSAPVVDLGRLLTGESAPPTRLVSLAIGEGRRVALAVESVEGLRDLSVAASEPLPPLFAEAAAGLIRSLGLLDEQLCAVLAGALRLPEAVWEQLEAPGRA